MNNLFSKKKKKEKEKEKSLATHGAGRKAVFYNVTQMFHSGSTSTTDSSPSAKVVSAKKSPLQRSMSKVTTEDGLFDSGGSKADGHVSGSGRTAMDFERSSVKIEQVPPPSGLAKNRVSIPKKGSSGAGPKKIRSEASQDSLFDSNCNRSIGIGLMTDGTQSETSVEDHERHSSRTTKGERKKTATSLQHIGLTLDGPTPSALTSISSTTNMEPRNVSAASEVHLEIPAVLEPIDDENNDYIVNPGELFVGRYVLGKVLGHGSFGQVLKAFDTVRNEYVAIKIVRSGSPYYEQSLLEVRMMTYVNGKDRSDSANIMRVFNKFVYRGHQCLVFELLSFSLYDFLQSGDFYGVSMNLVKQFGRQILKCLEFLSQPEVNVIHCDLKPENVLLRHSQRAEIKVVDFGSSVSGTNNLTLYVQSRFYRAPEVIIGCVPYNGAIDVWSLGCMLVELHVGYSVFPGQSEKDQMALIVEKLGIPPEHMLNSGKKSKNFFELNEDGKWAIKKGMASREEDAELIPGSLSVRKFIEDLSVGVDERRRQSSAVDLEQFFDLIGRMLIYDPVRRITPTEALQHPFFSSNKNKGTGRDHSPPPVMNMNDISNSDNVKDRVRESGRAAPVRNKDAAEDDVVGLQEKGADLEPASGEKITERLSNKYFKEDETWKEESGIQSPLWRDQTLDPNPRREELLLNAVRSSIFFCHRGSRIQPDTFGNGRSIVLQNRQRLIRPPPMLPRLIIPGGHGTMRHRTLIT